MPGIIRVSVLEAIDLPDVFTDGTTLTGVTVKVTLGPRLFKTQPGVADGGRIETWNSDFAFPVMNLRDKLVVSICDSEDQSMTQTAIEIPSIIQKGSRDEFVSLNKGGRIHLRMSFALTDDERKKIEAMRLAALKKRAELAKTVVFQPVQESLLELKQPPVLVEAKVDVDVSIVQEKGDSELQPNRSLGSVDSRPIPVPAPEQDPAPSPKSVLRPVFNFKKAIGLQSGLEESIERRSIVLVPENLVTEVANSNGNAVKSGVEKIRDVPEVDAFGTTNLVNASSAALSGCLDETCPVTTNSNHDITLPPLGEADSLMNEVKSHNLENRAEVGSPENAQFHVSLVSPSSSDGPVSLVKTKPTCSTSMAENLNDEVETKNRDRNSEVDTIRSESAENAFSSGDSVLNMSPVTELRAATASSIESPSKKSGKRSSVPITWKAVKARVTRTSPNFFFRRSSRSASSRTGVVAGTPPPGPVVWLQDWVRKGLSNIKECYAPAYPIQQHLQRK